eukprot:gene26415-34576_t
MSKRRREPEERERFANLTRLARFRENRGCCNAAIHPVTSEVIPRVFRMCAIAPVNIPIVAIMLLAIMQPGTKQSDQQLLTAYLLAVSSACAIATGLGRMVTRGPAFMRKYSFVIPCIATSFANVSNICFMRQDEIMSGTEVFDDEGNRYGLSKIAGTTALFTIYRACHDICEFACGVSSIVSHLSSGSPVTKLYANKGL